STDLVKTVDTGSKARGPYLTRRRRQQAAEMNIAVGRQAERLGSEIRHRIARGVEAVKAASRGYQQPIARCSREREYGFIVKWRVTGIAGAEKRKAPGHGIEHKQAVLRGSPGSALAVDKYRTDLAGGQSGRLARRKRRHPAGRRIEQVESLVGPRPDRAVGIDRQPEHEIAAQCMLIAFHVAKVRERPLTDIQPGDAAAVRANPQVAVRVEPKCPHAVGLQAIHNPRA